MNEREARSEAEARRQQARDKLAAAIIEAGLPAPEVDYMFNRGVKVPYDLAWPDRSLGVEIVTDGLLYDIKRMQGYEIWRVLQFPLILVEGRIETCLRYIRAKLLPGNGQGS